MLSVSIYGYALVVIVFIGCIACFGESSPDQLPKEVVTLGNCEAAKKAADDRIRVAGNFGGFVYETNSKLITLESEVLCNERGAGLAFTTLSNNIERKKLYSTKPGTEVIIEGTVVKVKQGRSVY